MLWKVFSLIVVPRKIEQMNGQEELRNKLVVLERRADNLEKKFDRIVGKSDEYVPRTTALMREGIPLEIFSRIAIIDGGFSVFGTYPFKYFNNKENYIERSVDIYAMRDSVYTVPDGKGRMSGQSWPERDHLLVEVKQRKPGVEWIFSRKPTSVDQQYWAFDENPIANVGFEIRPNENGISNSPNMKDVNNAISQLNQAYMPFMFDMVTKAEIKIPGMSARISSDHGKDHVYLLLVTNARLRMLTPPEKFSDVGPSTSEDDLFKEVPWISFHPEISISLQGHQQVLVDKIMNFRNTAFGAVETQFYDIANIMKDYSHEVHIVNFDHLAQFFNFVKNPPRLEGINIRMTVDGEDMLPFEIKP